MRNDLMNHLNQEEGRVRSFRAMELAEKARQQKFDLIEEINS